MATNCVTLEKIIGESIICTNVLDVSTDLIYLLAEKRRWIDRKDEDFKSKIKNARDDFTWEKIHIETTNIGQPESSILGKTEKEFTQDYFEGKLEKLDSLNGTLIKISYGMPVNEIDLSELSDFYHSKTKYFVRKNSELLKSASSKVYSLKT